MSGFWRWWFATWCLLIGVFGLVLAGGAFEGTSDPVQFILTTLRGSDEPGFEPALRFSLGVLGAVSIGWAVTLYFAIRAAITLGAQGRPIWNAISAGMISWFLIDSALSAATGFGLNIVPNIGLAGMYVVGLYGSQAMRPNG